MNTKKTNRQEYGPITNAIANIFAFLQRYMSDFFLGNRRFEELKDNPDPNLATERELMTIKRAKVIDRYILFFLLIEIIIWCFIHFGVPNWLSYVFLALIIYRVIDIVQINANISLFDAFKKGKTIYVASAVRTIINVIVNFFELIICFGYLYYFFGDKFIGNYNGPVYFSAVTQLTLGFPDEQKLTDIARIISVIHLVFAYFFGILIIGRFISLLPSIKTVAGDGSSDGEK
jgi:hypothetical protein